MNNDNIEQVTDSTSVTTEDAEQYFFRVSVENFRKIPGSPIAYWVSEVIFRLFSISIPLSEFADIGKGLDTGDNNRFLRQWHECERESKKWVPCQKGGPFRKWYGNNDFVINWFNDGAELKMFSGSNLRNSHNYFKEGLTWTRVSSSSTAFRLFHEGSIFESTGPCLFPKRIPLYSVASFLNSNLTLTLLKFMAPTLDFQSGHISALPILEFDWESPHVEFHGKRCIEIAKTDWDVYERSWNFKSLPILTASFKIMPTLELSYTAWITKNRETIAEMKSLEEENNRIFIDAYGLRDELTPEVPIEQITLTVNPAYRYGKKGEQRSVESGFSEELETRFREDTMKELISYAIGCMMGRYSLDEPGLIYAHSGNEDFDYSRHQTFPADDDGIVPLTDQEWFADDSTNRFREFIRVAWDESHLQENLDFVSESLCLTSMKSKRGESSLDTIRRYLSSRFYKDHLQTYKKRPIYWLFSSGKQKAFECLVYLHRYNEGTLSRMRTEYVTPLMGKYAAAAQKLVDDSENADSTAEANRLKKELSALEKKQTELRQFDDKLKHYADMRISLDLDDGVKVNYGKFGDLLAEVKAVTGEKPKDLL